MNSEYTVTLLAATHSSRILLYTRAPTTTCRRCGLGPISRTCSLPTPSISVPRSPRARFARQPTGTRAVKYTALPEKTDDLTRNARKLRASSRGRIAFVGHTPHESTGWCYGNETLLRSSTPMGRAHPSGGRTRPRDRRADFAHNIIFAITWYSHTFIQYKQIQSLLLSLPAFSNTTYITYNAYNIHISFSYIQYIIFRWTFRYIFVYNNTFPFYTYSVTLQYTYRYIHYTRLN